MEIKTISSKQMSLENENNHSEIDIYSDRTKFNEIVGTFKNSMQHVCQSFEFNMALQILADFEQKIRLLYKAKLGFIAYNMKRSYVFNKYERVI